MASYRSTGDIYYLETFLYLYTKQDGFKQLPYIVSMGVYVHVCGYVCVFVKSLRSCHLDRLFPCKQYKPPKHVSVMRIKGIVWKPL